MDLNKLRRTTNNKKQEIWKDGAIINLVYDFFIYFAFFTKIERISLIFHAYKRIVDFIPKLF